MAPKQKWVGKAISKPGALRRQLGMGEGETMSQALMDRIMAAEVGDQIEMPDGTKRTVTAQMKRRMQLAKTLKGMKRG